MATIQQLIYSLLLLIPKQSHGFEPEEWANLCGMVASGDSNNIIAKMIINNKDVTQSLFFRLADSLLKKSDCEHIVAGRVLVNGNWLQVRKNKIRGGLAAKSGQGYKIEYKKVLIAYFYNDKEHNLQQIVHLVDAKKQETLLF